MRGKSDPDWADLVLSWKAQQNELRSKLLVQPLDPMPRFVAGADAAFSNDKRFVFAAAVVYDRQDQRIVEVSHARRAAEVPYIPGFLTFREGPTITQAIQKLRHPFGAICFDGQGISIGHRVDLNSARQLVLACCNNCRVPEPTRQADIEVSRLKASYCPVPTLSG